MFEKVIITLILVLAAVLVFSGCSDVLHKADQLEDAVENKVEQMEDAVESKLDPIEDAIESKADQIEDAAEQALSNVLTSDGAVSNAPQSEPLSDEAIGSQADPAQSSIDKLMDLVGGVVKEQASADHIPDSVVDSGASENYAQPVFITPEEAQRIALQHAGIDAADALFDRVERDFNHGIYHYEVEFRVGHVEYDYDINAESGEIIRSEKDIDD